MRGFTIATVAKRLAILSAVAVCLSSACLSDEAAAKPIIKIITGGPGKPIPGTNNMGTDTNLRVGPGGTGPGHRIPAICGLLGLSGIFDNSTVVRIEVEGDDYHLVRQWSAAHKSQPAYWVGAVVTCVQFTQLKSTPSILDWGVFRAPPAPSSGDVSGIGTDVTIPGSGTQYACIWAGVTGGLSEVPAGQPLANVVFTRFNPTMHASDNYAQSTPISSLTSYAWCSGFKSSWSWKYYSSAMPLVNAASGSGLLPGPPINRNVDWCFMEGIFNTNPGKITVWPSFPGGNYAENISKGAQMFWNCLPYIQ